MRKPVISYRELSLATVNQPRYRHLLFLFGWVGYFCLYFLTENGIPAEACTPVWCPLDDVIPFCEFFVIPYVGWYVLIVLSLLWFMFYNPEHFRALMKFIIVTQVVAMAIYILFPTRQDLRPDAFPRDNVFTDIVALLYAADTNTGVCPSLHVAYSVGIASTWLKEKGASPLAKGLLTLFCALVCVSIAFVKQHSVVDAFAAVPVCLLAEWVAFGDFWRARRRVSG